MPEVAVVNSAGAEVGKIALLDEVFQVEPNVSLMHQAVINHLANMRQGNADTLTRDEVRGGGRKPWRQKGTGRARQGSIRAPHWYHGGVVFGPHPKDYTQNMPKKMRRLALWSALSAKLSEGEIKVVDQLKMDSISTKQLVAKLNSFGINGKALLVIAEPDENISKSAKNIPWLILRVAPLISTYELLNANVVVFTQDAVIKVQEAQVI